MNHLLNNKKTSLELRKRLVARPMTLAMNNPYLGAATSPNTRRAYQADIRHFEAWGGSLPASTETILHYLQTFAEQLNPRTLARRLTALKNWHVYQGFNDPISHPAIRKTLTGIQRTHGKPPQKAHPLLPEDLVSLVTFLENENTLRAKRDSALVQLAFFGAFRRSELVAIQVEHLHWQEKGVEILIPHSKTDPTHDGQFCAVPYGNAQLCAVRALKHWLEIAEVTQGPLFRRLHRNGQLGEAPLTPLAITQILQKRAQMAQLPMVDKLSSHSFRRGLATSASREGASIAAIMRQGRWKNVNTVMEYIEAAQRFEENAASHVLKKVASAKIE